MESKSAGRSLNQRRNQAGKEAAAPHEPTNIKSSSLHGIETSDSIDARPMPAPRGREPSKNYPEEQRSRQTSKGSARS